jgi:hypothetical protein
VKREPGMVVPTYNPSCLEGRDENIMLKGWPRQKVSKNLFHKSKPGVVMDTCGLNYSRSGSKRIVV